jgi:hypothetical protein
MSIMATYYGVEYPTKMKKTPLMRLNEWRQKNPMIQGLLRFHEEQVGSGAWRCSFMPTLKADSALGLEPGAPLSVLDDQKQQARHRLADLFLHHESFYKMQLHNMTPTMDDQKERGQSGQLLRKLMEWRQKHYDVELTLSSHPNNEKTYIASIRFLGQEVVQATGPTDLDAKSAVLQSFFAKEQEVLQTIEKIMVEKHKGNTKEAKQEQKKHPSAKERKTTITNDAHVAEAWCLLHPSVEMFALDFEFVHGKAAVMQLSSADSILIYSFYREKQLSEAIREFLTSQWKKKCTIDDTQDRITLKRDWNVQLEGLVDLRLCVPEGRPKCMGMKRLAALYLGIELEKDKQTQLSDWSRWPLSEEQVKYASEDVNVIYELSLVLLSKTS